LGFSWNTYQGAKDLEEENQINECFAEFEDQLMKRYSNEEYDDIVKEACQFVDPESGENIIMVASHYLCDQVVSHIKNAFKNIKKRQFTPEQLNEMRIEKGQEEFDRFMNLDFTDFITAEKNNLNQNAFDLYNERKDKPEPAFEKYREKCEKAIGRARGSQKDIDNAKKRYEYNMRQYNFKLTVFYNTIFNENIQRKVYKLNKVDYNAVFMERLDKLLGSKNKFGTRVDTEKIPGLIHLINNELSQKKEVYIKMIFDKIPSDLMNCKEVILMFKNNMMIDYLWNKVFDSITIENPGSFCIDLLKEFFKESVGLREAYIGLYMDKIDNLSKDMSFDQQKEFLAKQVIT
jgi:hypothetical protein